jgi:hypothetical protein
MGYRLREMGGARNFAQELDVAVISRIVPPGVVRAALAAEGVATQRARKLTVDAAVYVLIAMNLFPHLSMGDVVTKIAQGLRYIWPDPEIRVGTASALTYRRTQVGARPLVALFHQVCRPLATAQTKGAFLFGLRLMAIDGTTEDVPDTPANAAVFGRHHSQRGASAFPQVRGVYLTECGTHAIVDAGFWPCHTSERVGGRRLLRSLAAGMLVLWDCGFHEYDLLAGVRQRRAHALGRLPSHVKPQRVRTLADGSYLAYLFPSDYQRRKRGERLLVRIIAYTVTDPALVGYGELHRLVTTLLNPRLAPALEVACAYHERWEGEIVIDELDTHQRLAARTLRSLTPVGVIQELYALLIAHYAVRTLMHEAALSADVDPDRLSFVGAVRVIQNALPEFQMTAPDQLPHLYRRLLHDIAAKRIPRRRLRVNPRVVKRKMSKFPLKRPEQFHPPPLTGSFCDRLALVI